MKKFLLIFLCFFSFMGLRAQQINFSDSSVISLLTCSPGEEVYARFGHTGVRVYDPIGQKDLVFNYGLFSFNTKNFYYKFIKGETDYLLGVQPTDYFLAEYRDRNSQVWEQILNLTPIEKRKIIDALVENYRPENRTYRYNFVFDNCATRPRDRIINGIDGYVQLQTSNETKTYRQWISYYVGHDTWLNFGIDLVFGMQADNETRQFDSMFLPEVLMNEFELAKIYTKDRKDYRMLVLETKVLVESEETPVVSASVFSKPFPVLFALLLVVVAVCLFEFKTKKYYTIIDSVFLFASGVGGLIVAYLMLVSIHPLVKYNLNILWLNPFNIVAAFLIWFKTLRIPMFLYQLMNISLLLLSLIVLALSIQTFNASAFPLIVILLLRYSTWVVRIKHKIFRKSKFQIKGFGN